MYWLLRKSLLKFTSLLYDKHIILLLHLKFIYCTWGLYVCVCKILNIWLVIYRTVQMDRCSSWHVDQAVCTCKQRVQDSQNKCKKGEGRVVHYYVRLYWALACVHMDKGVVHSRSYVCQFYTPCTRAVDNYYFWT